MVMWQTEIEFKGKADIPDTIKLASKDRLIDAIKQITEETKVVFDVVIAKRTLASVSGNKKIITFGLYDSKDYYFAHGTIEYKD